MDSPDVYLWAKVPWQIFVTLTWAESKSEGIRQRVLFAWLRRLSKTSGRHFHRLLWAVRQERGEIGGREHYHVLLGGLPEHRVTDRLMPLARKWWKRCGGGFAWVNAYCPSSEGVQYVLKGLGSVEASSYELLKTSRADKGMASKSAQAFILSRVATASEPGTPPQTVGNSA